MSGCRTPWPARRRFGADPCRDDGDGRRLHGRAPVGHLSACAGSIGARRRRSASSPRSSPRRSRIVQTDIKKVLAYSTISQLGFMFVALRRRRLRASASSTSITHAFFKACLFLGAGSVIHALGGEQDMRKMGGLRAPHSDHLRDVRHRHRRHRGHSAARRLLLQGRDPLVRVRQRPRRLAAALRRRRRHRAADVVLHVPAAVAHVLRSLAHVARNGAPRARIAAVDDRRPGRARGAVGDRRLPAAAALSRAAAAAARSGRRTRCDARRR